MTKSDEPSLFSSPVRRRVISRLLPALVLLALGVLCSVAGAAEDATTSKLHSIIFPEFRMEDTSIGEAVLYAKMRSRQLDPEHVGVELTLDPAVDASRKITISLANIPLSGIVGCLEAVAGLKANISESGVVFTSAQTAAAPPSSTTPEPVAPPPAPPKPADYTACLAVIEGDRGMGSGFIAQFNHAPVLFTNVHVLAANSAFTARTLNGQKIDIKSIYIAEAPGGNEKCDVAAIEQSTVSGGLELLDNVESHVNIGDDVIVLGNSLGAGVVTQIPGKVLGIGPDFIEVDAAFVAGNSGSPVIHVPTGKVIGIATFATMRKMEGFGKDSRFNNTERRFAVRLDNMPAWKTIAWPQLAFEAATLRAISRHTTELVNIAEDIHRTGKVTYAMHEGPGNSLASIVSDYQQIMESPGTPNDYRAAQQRLFFWLHHATEKDLTGLNYSRFSSYTKKEIDAQSDLRDQLQKYWEFLGRGVEATPSL